MYQIKKIAIIGMGGLAREISCNLPKNSFNYFVNKNFIKKNLENCYAIEDMDISKYKVLIAIGDPLIRKKIVNELPIETEYFTYIDKFCRIIDNDNVKIGKGSILTAGTILTTNISLGEFSILNLNTTVGHDAILGNFLTTTPGVHISGETNIGNENFFGCGSVIRNKVNICNNVIIGMNSVVNKDILESGTYVGIPAKKIK